MARAETLQGRPGYPELAVIGHIRSTLFLPASVLGGQGAAFDADLTAALGPYGDGGTFTETVEFAYKLAGKPASLSIADDAFPDGIIQAQ